MLMGVLGFVFTVWPPELERRARLIFGFVFVLLAVVIMLAAVEQQKRSGASQQRTDDRIVAGNVSTDIQLAAIDRKLDIFYALPRPEQIKRETEQAQRDELAKAEEVQRGKIYLAAPTFTPENLEALRSQLAKAHGRVNISALMNDSHSLWDARHLAQAFRSADWEVTGVDRVGGFSATPEGVYILARSPESGFAGFVQSALQQSIGVEAKGSLVPTMPEGEIDIIVGETEW